MFNKKAVLAAGIAAFAVSANAAESWNPTLDQIQTQYIIPKYDAMSQSAEQLAQSVASLCAAPDASHLTQTQDAFRANVADWQTIQWLNFGPVTYFMRYYAYEYWPDKKGVTQRQLRALSASPITMEAPKFWSSASIAVRGMTAIESLLFHPDFDVLNRPSDCEVLEAVARHHATTSEDVLNQWRESQSTDWVFAEEGDNTSLDHMVVEQFVQQWLEHMSMVKDAKLETPIGYNTRPNLKLAEFYRSEQSLSSIQTNLKAHRVLYHSGSPSLFDNAMVKQPELAAALENALADNVKIALQLPDDYFTGEYTQEERISLAKPLVKSISNSQIQLTNLVTALGFQIGFNSRDGD